MKTHPESIWLDGTRISMAKNLDTDFFSVVVSGSKVLDSDLEFVPAAAYTELKNELAAANAQLQTQTENMRELRELVEMIADKPHFGELPADIVEQAQDLIGRITR